MNRKAAVVLIALSMLLDTAACQQRLDGARAEPGGAGNFDSYVLSLSWAPAFCAQAGQDRSYRECDPRRHVGFVVHGLWPQRRGGGILEDCARVHPVSHDIVEDMLSIMPDRGLIQHEWRAHGSCTGMSSREYFASVKKAYSRVKIPGQFRERGRQIKTASAQVERQFQAAASLPESAIRVTCRQRELTEVRICLSRSLDPTPCSNQVSECGISSLTVRPIP